MDAFRDTVCSVGLYPRTLPFTTSNTLVRTFRHALALDERRTKFQPNLWNRPDEKERELGRDAGGAGGSGARLDKGRSRGRSGVDKENLFAMLKYMEEPPKEEMEMENSGEQEPTDVEEVRGSLNLRLLARFDIVIRRFGSQAPMAVSSRVNPQ